MQLLDKLTNLLRLSKVLHSQNHTLNQENKRLTEEVTLLKLRLDKEREKVRLLSTKPESNVTNVTLVVRKHSEGTAIGLKDQKPTLIVRNNKVNLLA